MMGYLIGAFALWNAVVLLLEGTLLNRYWKTQFPLSNEDRLEQYRTPFTWKELIWRLGGFALLLLTDNGVLFILLLRSQ